MASCSTVYRDTAEDKGPTVGYVVGQRGPGAAVAFLQGKIEITSIELIFKRKREGRG